MKSILKNYWDIIGVIAISLLFLGVVVSLTPPKEADARIATQSGDLVVTQTERVDNVFSNFVLTNLSGTATNTILVDLSDITNFPHYRTGSVQVSKIFGSFTTTDALASTTLQFGVFASTSATSVKVSDIYWFDEIYYDTLLNDRGVSQFSIDYAPSAVKLDIASGAPNSFLSNNKDLATTTLATTTLRNSPNGYIAPGVGDLVMRADSIIGTITISVSAMYDTIK